MSIPPHPGLATDAERKLEQYRTEAMLSRMANTLPSSPVPKWQKLLIVFVFPLRREWTGETNDILKTANKEIR